MDSFEESASKTPMRLDCDNDKIKNCKVTPRQCGVNEDIESVFTSMSSQADPSCSVQNGPRTRNLNSLSSNESGQSSRLSENNSDYFRNISSECNKVNTSSTCTEHGDTSRSKTDSSTCANCVEVIPEVQSCQRHKVCMDRVGFNYNQPSTSGSSKSAEVTENSFKENRKRPSSLKLNRPNLDEDSSSDTGNDDYSLGSEDGCIYTYRGGEHLADLPSSFFSLDMGLPLDKHLPIPPNYPAGQQGTVNAARERNSRASSPDMDFLEMDFDPGPSCEVDTGDESTPDAELDAASNMPEDNEPVMMRGVSPEYAGVSRINPSVVCASSDAGICYDVPSTSRGVSLAQGDVAEEPRSNHVFYGPYITHVNARGEHILVRRTMCHWPHNAPVSLHISSGDLVSPREMLNYEEDTERSFAHQINQGERPTFDSANLSSALYHMTMAKRLMVEKTRSDIENFDSVNMAGDAQAACSSLSSGASCAETPRSMVWSEREACERQVTQIATSACGATAVVNIFAGDAQAACSSLSSGASCAETPRSMVWSEREACERQVTQIATSACGATAVVNIFIALGVPVNIEKINSAVNTRQRANNAPLPRYLLSRAVAGCTAADLVNGIQRASDGLVTARFFPTYPERAMSLSHWLADWISLGAVPILTLNLQVGCDGEIPDAWHHQMVFGVSSRGVYLCNPVECVRETALWPRLTSPSVLLVRTRDVVSRFSATTDLTPLMAVPDRRFHTFNVLGQVVNVIREWRATGWSEAGTRTRHIRLPAAYQAGVTVAALTGTEAHKRLSLAAQLPILAPQIDPDK